MGAPKGDGNQGAGLLDTIKEMIRIAKSEIVININSVNKDLTLNISTLETAQNKKVTDLEDRLRELEAATKLKDD